MRPQPGFIDPVNEVIIVVIGEAHFGTENDGKTDLIAPFFLFFLAGHITVNYEIPVMFGIRDLEKLIVKMVCDHKAGVALSSVCIYGFGSRDLSAGADFDRMDMGVV